MCVCGSCCFHVNLGYCTIIALAECKNLSFLVQFVCALMS